MEGWRLLSASKRRWQRCWMADCFILWCSLTASILDQPALGFSSHSVRSSSAVNWSCDWFGSVLSDHIPYHSLVPHSYVVLVWIISSVPSSLDSNWCFVYRILHIFSRLKYRGVGAVNEHWIIQVSTFIIFLLSETHSSPKLLISYECRHLHRSCLFGLRSFGFWPHLFEILFVWSMFLHSTSFYFSFGTGAASFEDIEKDIETWRFGLCLCYIHLHPLKPEVFAWCLSSLELSSSWWFSLFSSLPVNSHHVSLWLASALILSWIFLDLH